MAKKAAKSKTKAKAKASAPMAPVLGPEWMRRELQEQAAFLDGVVGQLEQLAPAQKDQEAGRNRPLHPLRHLANNARTRAATIRGVLANAENE